MHTTLKSLFLVGFLFAGSCGLFAGSQDLHEETRSLDLGVLPVGEVSDFLLELPYSGVEQFVVSIEPDCSCLEITKAPESLTSDSSSLGFAFKPNGAGPAQIHIAIKTVDAASGAEGEYTVPVSVVGFDRKDSDTWSTDFGVNRIQASMAYQALGKYRVIDIRGSEAYEKAHVPGSLEYSLDALLVQKYLFKRPVLLVGTSALKQRERSLLAKLGKSGVDVTWLEGGMAAWLRAGYTAEGIWPSAVRASRITLDRWLDNAATPEQWEVLDLSGAIIPGERFFGHRVIHPENHSPAGIQAAVSQALENVMRRAQGKAVLIIGDARELVYPLAEAGARKAGPIEVYYLTHGVLAYHNWKRGAHPRELAATYTISSTSSNQLPAPGASHTIGSAGSSGCSVCPKKR